MDKGKIINQVKDHIRCLLGRIFSAHPRLHRIPFGPLKGRKIFMSPTISLRMFFGIDEPWIARLCKILIRPSDVVYDIGAHIGYTTLLFANFLYSTGVVHAFEILPSTADFMSKTVKANNFRNISVHAVGLGSVPKILELPVGCTAMTSILEKPQEGQRCERCKVVTLDTYINENGLPLPNLIKIDIEGAEIECLMGSIKLISECRPTMIIAFHSKKLLHQGYELLRSLDYSIYDKLGSLSERSITEFNESFNDSILCLPIKRAPIKNNEKRKIFFNEK